MAIRFSYQWKRVRVRWRRWKRSLDNSIKPESSKLTAYESKGIRLWKICLRDEETQMAYNSYGVRQIEKDNIFIILSPANGSDKYIMTIMDITSERRSLYELHIEGRHANSTCEAFDDEMDKRMNKAQNSKRDLIETDIDKMIEHEEKILFRKIEERNAKKRLDSGKNQL